MIHKLSDEHLLSTEDSNIVTEKKKEKVKHTNNCTLDARIQITSHIAVNLLSTEDRRKAKIHKVHYRVINGPYRPFSHYGDLAGWQNSPTRTPNWKRG